VALWTRVEGFAATDLYAALQGSDLVVGALLRHTLHLVSPGTCGPSGQQMRRT